jgi:hypothetical protein
MNWIWKKGTRDEYTGDAEADYRLIGRRKSVEDAGD